MKRFLAALIVLPLVNACVPSEPTLATTQPTNVLQGAALEARLANSQITVQGQGSDGAVIAMQLSPGGVGAVSSSLGGQAVMDVGVRWSVEGDKLCTVALLGASLGDSTKDCVQAVIAGDQIRLVRTPSSGNAEVFTGTIRPL